MEISLFSLARFINIFLALCLIGYSFFVILALGGFNPLTLMMSAYYMYTFRMINIYVAYLHY